MSRQRRQREDAGFSMIELLVTIVLAGIVFAAMVPFFANALKRTSADELRVDATNIAQDRIEQTRLLAYADITSANLNSPPSPASEFGDGRYGSTYTLVGESRSYGVSYVVTPLTDANAKYVRVEVSRPGSDSYVTAADTIIDNPEPGDTSWTEAEPTGLTMAVWFDVYSYVRSPGVTMRRVQTNVDPNVEVNLGSKMPDPITHECTWTGLTGGPNYTYRISCWSTRATYEMNAPPFRLWTNGRLKFDTYPGGD